VQLQCCYSQAAAAFRAAGKVALLVMDAPFGTALMRNFRHMLRY
jgi:hypothetical protein